MRRCRTCDQEKPHSEFHTRNDGRFQNLCKTCKSAYNREWYRRNRDMHRRNVASLKRQQRDANVELMYEAKRAPCADCGRRYPVYVMDFDHVRGVKRGNVAEMRAESSKRVREEMAKCDVVCANCHRVRTHGKAGT